MDAEDILESLGSAYTEAEVARVQVFATLAQTEQLERIAAVLEDFAGRTGPVAVVNTEPQFEVLQRIADALERAPDPGPCRAMDVPLDAPMGTFLVCTLDRGHEPGHRFVPARQGGE